MVKYSQTTNPPGFSMEFEVRISVRTNLNHKALLSYEPPTEHRSEFNGEKKVYRPIENDLSESEIEKYTISTIPITDDFKSASSDLEATLAKMDKDSHPL